MNNSMLLKIGRILFGLGMLMYGLSHLMQSGAMAGQVLAGWPMAQALIIISGIGLTLAGISLLINKYVRLACLLLALEILIITIGVHIMGEAMSSDPMEAQMGIIHSIHNFVTIGFCFVMAAISSKE